MSDGKVASTPSVRFQIMRDGTKFKHHSFENAEEWRIGLSILKGTGQRWLPIRKPGAYTAGVFQALCSEIGITLPSPQAEGRAPLGTQIAQRKSVSVYEMLRGMLKYSNNLTAEALGASAGYASGSTPRNIRHAAGLTSVLAANTVGGIGGGGWNGFSLENHSGLSVLSRASPRQLAFILRDAQQRWGDDYLALFNNRSITRRHLKGAIPPRHFIFGKTGSMHFVRGLAGFININARPMVYAFIANEDNSRAILNNSFTPYGDPMPSAAANWSRRTKAFENAMLKEWVLRYSV